MVPAVLDVVPDPERDLQEFIAQRLGVVDAVLLAAELDPPVAHFPPGVAAGAIGQLLVLLEAVRPGGRLERLGRTVFPRLEKAGHPHRSVVRCFRRDGLAVFAPRLAAHPPLRARQRRQDPVARAVRVERGPDPVRGLGRELPPVHARDPVALHLRIEAGAVEEEREVRLEPRTLVQDQVPDGEIPVRVPAEVLEPQLFEDARLAEIGNLAVAVRAADVHAHLAGGVSAEDRPVVHQRDLRAAPRR